MVGLDRTASEISGADSTPLSQWEKPVDGSGCISHQYLSRDQKLSRAVAAYQPSILLGVPYKLYRGSVNQRTELSEACDPSRSAANLWTPIKTPSRPSRTLTKTLNHVTPRRRHKADCHCANSLSSARHKILDANKSPHQRAV